MLADSIFFGHLFHWMVLAEDLVDDLNLHLGRQLWTIASSLSCHRVSWLNILRRMDHNWLLMGPGASAFELLGKLDC